MKIEFKILLFFTLIGISLLFIDFIPVNSISYKELYNRTPYKNSIAKSCSISYKNTNFHAKDCIKVSKNEWHINPCGMPYWCSIKLNQTEIKLLKENQCLTNENTVSLAKYIMRKYYYHYNLPKEVVECL